MNESHYCNLSDYHRDASRFAAEVAQALTDKADAETRLRNARQNLARVHKVIVRYYAENEGEEKR